MENINKKRVDLRKRYINFVPNIQAKKSSSSPHSPRPTSPPLPPPPSPSSPLPSFISNSRQMFMDNINNFCKYFFLNNIK